jgi:hypothetical protein
LGRLAKVFYQVHPTARVLINSKKNPLYLFVLCVRQRKGRKARDEHRRALIEDLTWQGNPQSSGQKRLGTP